MPLLTYLRHIICPNDPCAAESHLEDDSVGVTRAIVTRNLALKPFDHIFWTCNPENVVPTVLCAKFILVIDAIYLDGVTLKMAHLWSKMWSTV